MIDNRNLTVRLQNMCKYPEENRILNEEKDENKKKLLNL